MSAVLADTQSIVWYLLKSSRLSSAAKLALSTAEQTKAGIFVSTVSVVEVIYLVEKNKLPPSVLTALVDVLADPIRPITALDMDFDVARAAQHIPRRIVPDLPDRMIAATALAHSLPLVTSDAKIQAAPIQTIW